MQFHMRIRGARNSALLAAGVMLVVSTLATPSSAVSAQKTVASAATVTSLSVTAPVTDSQYSSVLTLSFDQPVAAAAAAQYRSQLADSLGVSASQLGPVYISCGGSGDWSDANGHLSMQYTCPRPVLAWGWNVSTAVQAIIVGNINERGLSWWLNGRAMPRNGPHNVPKYYQIHGSMTGASTNAQVDYQDYITFRHNVGPGGTGSITWAGRVHTLSD